MDDEERRRYAAHHPAERTTADSGGRQDERQHAPSAERTAQPIAEVLDRYLPAHGTVLEVASGTGQHIVRFAALRPGITWLPSDPSPDARRSIAGWTRASGRSNIQPPRELDLTVAGWHATVPGELTALVASNLLHISPWEASRGLLAGAARCLAPGGWLFIYGCLRLGGEHLTDANAAFDANLRARNPRWGVRDLDEVTDAARRAGLGLTEVVAMPADNRLLILAPPA